MTARTRAVEDASKKASASRTCQINSKGTYAA